MTSLNPPEVPALPTVNEELERAARAVREGLTQTPKQLPPWLFYDAIGSRLYEQITELPEYYLTRAERSIFEENADAIIARAFSTNDKSTRWSLVELGSGTATKSQLLVHAAARGQGRTSFMPSDVSEGPLRRAVERLAREEPLVEVRPIVGHHEEALAEVARLQEPVLLLFIGSSIGNHDEAEAQTLLRAIRRSLRAGSALLLGADLRKDPAVLVSAYDDAQGVTAAFNKNLLVRLNRELGANFQLERFRHVAVWNEAKSRIEMHLESLVEQRISIPASALEVRLGAGERIHTESSVKYDSQMIGALLTSSGFAREATFLDGAKQFAVVLARAASDI